MPKGQRVIFSRLDAPTASDMIVHCRRQRVSSTDSMTTGFTRSGRDHPALNTYLPNVDSISAKVLLNMGLITQDGDLLSTRNRTVYIYSFLRALDKSQPSIRRIPLVVSFLNIYYQRMLFPAAYSFYKALCFDIVIIECFICSSACVYDNL